MVYAATLFLSSGLLFAVHVPNGTFLHSAVALVPYAYLLTLLGVGGVVTAVARRRTELGRRVARRACSRSMAVGVVLLLGIGATDRMTARDWQHARDMAVAVAAPLAAVPPDDRLMTPDAGGFRYLTGRQGIVTPEDPLPVVEDALRRYGIRWLILERDFSTVALAPVLDGRGPTRLAVGAHHGGARCRASRADPSAALYAVCLTAGR